VIDLPADCILVIIKRINESGQHVWFSSWASNLDQEPNRTIPKSRPRTLIIAVIRKYDVLLTK